MKRIITIATAMFFALTLTACKDDVKDLSSVDQIKEGIAGEVVHTATFSKGLDGGVAKLDDDDVFAINLAIDTGTPIKTGVTLVCDLPTRTMGVATNIKGNNGRVVSDPVGFSVMKYKKGTTTITERDEEVGVAFSTSNGNEDIIKFLTVDLGRLPSDSYVAFTLDTIDSNGDVVAGGWSPLIKVKDLTKFVGKLRMDVCGSSKLSIDDPEWLATFSDEDVRRMAGK